MEDSLSLKDSVIGRQWAAVMPPEMLYRYRAGKGVSKTADDITTALNCMDSIGLCPPMFTGIRVGDWESLSERCDQFHSSVATPGQDLASRSVRTAPVDCCCNHGCNGPAEFACSKCRQVA